MNCPAIIEAMLAKTPIPEHTLRLVCNAAMEILVEESNVVRVGGAVNVVGDIHGQFYDLLKLIQMGICGGM